MRHFIIVSTILVTGSMLIGFAQSAPPASPNVTATRLPGNPLVTVASSASIGDNVNGPSIVRVPPWVKQPLGRYYMYFAHHTGTFVRLAYADAIAGPWKVYEPGVLQVRDTAFYRPQPDPPDSPDGFYTHVASPEIALDAVPNRFVMWFHGWWTSSTRWPVESAVAARAWARANGYGQYTQAAVSEDGIHFEVKSPITRESYLRVFREDRYFYGVSRLGVLSRTTDPLGAFELGPNPFAGTAYENRVRHVALARRGRTMFVFFTAIGDAPEHVLVTTIDLSGDWTTWKAAPPIDVLTPEAAYECPDLPNVPSAAGEIEGRAKQIRDPAVFEEAGKTWLFYTICGEQGIAAAELTISPTRSK